MVYALSLNFFLILGVLCVSNLLSEGVFDTRFIIVSAALSLVGAAVCWYIFSKFDD